MKTVQIISLLAVAVLIIAGGVILLTNDGDVEASGILITNTDGTTATLPEAAERIVVMNKNSAEALIVLGVGDRVVGASNSTYSNSAYKQFLPNATNVGSSTQPSLDLIVSLDPDVIIGFSTMKIKNQDNLVALGYPVIYLDCYIPGQLQDDITNLGKAVGAEAEAQEYIDYYDEKLEIVTDALDTKTASEKADKRVYVEFSSTTYTSGYPAQCEGTSTDVILDTIGVTNVANGLEYGSYVQADWLATTDSDYLFKIYDLSKSTTGSTASEFSNRSCFQAMPAIDDDEVYLIYNQISYGPRSFCAVLVYTQVFFPDLLTGEDVQDWLEDYNDEFGTEFDTDMGLYACVS